ncbi:cell division protein SepF [Leekyejoonella antrihumi]|uniref:Cell division protein SepF n=1 Tax=Leekyejoonella antrihumi TaxID=1660198 RepID=A0A563DYI0_9MICO|nr:cell division protein SepF [Leekyejoonella antrihumi]TWP35179.1 cell division protein SepF [Leekyejoonella antrihumi]
MAGTLRKTMEYLGLAEVDSYDDGYDDDNTTYDGQHGGYGTGRDTGYAEDDVDREPAPVTQLHKGPVTHAVSTHEAGAMSRINTIHPRTYNEAKEIGESFRDGVPVIMNLSDMDDNDAKRLVDFAAGLVFGLHGTIERVTSKVFLLSPAGVEVATSGADAKRGTGRGLFNQS